MPSATVPVSHALDKTPSGITGFDQITAGGLPRGRTTLVCGGPGCGKTLFAMEFLVNGALRHKEPGVFIAFEESETELASNAASLGFDLAALQKKKLLLIDYVRIDRNEIEESGEYDLEGLFVRLGHAIDAIGAKRIVIDTLETLFASFDNEAVLRSELRRLFRWLKDRGITAIITGERGDGQLTRFGLEEYVSDCVISLDNRVADQVATRRLRIVKYRGSAHGANEYPFLIDDSGFSVLPVTSLGLDYPVSKERVSTGIAGLDEMLQGGGAYRGSSVLISGSAGTGKSSIAAKFVEAACGRGERALYFALEESASQVIRNMQSIGCRLQPLIDGGQLHIQAARPTFYGLEMHLVAMHKAVEEFGPTTVIVDPISSLIASGNPYEVKSMLVRLFDYLKNKRITCLVTALEAHAGHDEANLGVSSLIDTWFQLRDVELAGERTRTVYLVKSRGMGHSNQVRELVITDHGLRLVPVAIGPNGVLLGAARERYLAEQRGVTIAMQHAHEQQRLAIDARVSAETPSDTRTRATRPAKTRGKR